MSGIKYWLWLTERKNMTPITRRRVLEHFGSPESVYFADGPAYKLVEGLPEKARRSLDDKSLDCADRIMGDCDRLGIHIMTLQDAAYPERLRAIHQPPLVLYWKGRELSVDEELVIGMVGTRKATPYGEQMAGELATGLARAGAVIVSGSAKGVDAASLQGAMKAGGPVISVLGNGMDVIYPAAHKRLYADVAANGTLLSEFPPGTEPLPTNFPVRNRIISGLSAGVIVVESPKRGGSLLTANHALEQGRELFAVPGPVNAPNSEGTNNLIQEGAAKLVKTAEDVLCEFEGLFPLRARRDAVPAGRGRSRRREAERSRPPAEKPAAEKEVDNPPAIEYIDWKDCRDRLTDDQRDILLALEGGPLVADDLVERTQIPARRVLAALTILQVQGMAAEESGKRFRGLVKIKME